MPGDLNDRVRASKGHHVVCIAGAGKCGNRHLFVVCAGPDLEKYIQQDLNTVLQSGPNTVTAGNVREPKKEYTNEFSELKIKSKNLGLLLKNARNIFLKEYP